MSQPNRVVEGYDWVIGSSELGSCLVAQAAARLGQHEPLPTSAKMLELYEKGYLHEAECLISLRMDGWQVTGEQAEYVIDCGDRVGIVVHVDGLISSEAVPERVLEIKSPSTWRELERAVRTGVASSPYIEQCLWQLSSQLVATGLEATVACVNVGRLQAFGVELPPYPVEAIQARVEALRGLVAAGWPETCDGKMYPCPWLRHIKHTSMEPDLDFDEELDSMLSAYAAAQTSVKSLRAEIDAYYAGDSYHSAAGKITRFPRISKSYDYKRMKADGINIEAYAVTKESQVLKITGGDVGSEAASAAGEPESPRERFEL